MRRVDVFCLRSGGPDLRATQVYPIGYGKRVCTLHKLLMDPWDYQSWVYYQQNPWTSTHKWSQWKSRWKFISLSLTYWDLSNVPPRHQEFTQPTKRIRIRNQRRGVPNMHDSSQQLPHESNPGDHMFLLWWFYLMGAKCHYGQDSSKDLELQAAVKRLWYKVRNSKKTPAGSPDAG